jgi:gluconokinase
VLMGVSGSGKTTLGILIAKRAGDKFAVADDFHSTANKAKIAAGTPLSDEDRQPWLKTLNGVLQRWLADGQSGVLACSALKERYREALATGMPGGCGTVGVKGPLRQYGVVTYNCLIHTLDASHLAT